LRDADLPSRHYDLIFARLVFLFFPNPVIHLRKLARVLKPGSVLAVQEYHRDSFVLIPKPDGWSRLIEAERAVYAATGADVNIGTRLPVLREAGLRATEILPTIKVGGPCSAVWKWLSGYFLGIMYRYARLRPLDARRAQQIRRADVVTSCRCRG
jgi:SAM-dependent methyltransferase